MNKQLVSAALGKIWALVFRSTQERLTTEQENELDTAISELLSNWDKNDSSFRRVKFVCQSAGMHLSDIRALPPRKTQGSDALMENCHALQVYLEEMNCTRVQQKSP